MSGNAGPVHVHACSIHRSAHGISKLFNFNSFNPEADLSGYIVFTVHVDSFTGEE